MGAIRVDKLIVDTDKLKSIAIESIENDKDEIKSLIRERILKVCDDVLPLQIISKTVWEMDIPKESRERILSCLTVEYLNYKENYQDEHQS